MSLPLKLTICLQNRLFRECLTMALRAIEQYDITITESSTLDTTPRPDPEHHEVLLIDAGFPDSAAFTLVQKMRSMDQRPRMILMVSSAVPELIESCLRAGADGCLLDDDTLDDLCKAIESVRAGLSYCSPQFANRLFTRTEGLGRSIGPVEQSRECRLTDRELEVLRLIEQRNLSNKQIARELRISIFTVKNHVHSIFEKLSVEDRRAAVRYAVGHGLLEARSNLQASGHSAG